jgi:hypothetical protein
MVRTSWVRGLGARAYRASARRVAPGISDTQCGFKVFDGELARRIFPHVHTAGFSFDVELLARLQLEGASIAEFPVRWVDVPGSTFSPARHGADSFIDLAAIAWLLRGSWDARAAIAKPTFAAPDALPAIEA